ncbi:hypothetical protein [Paenibacillus pabuli]|uniref:hypothetical protein n=1 Tax=Paenibacillus pabuli TaxID=1472 RepID=UPI003CF31025
MSLSVLPLPSRNYIRAIEAMNDIKFTLFMNWKDGGDTEFYGAIMDKQGIESHCADLILFNQFLWRNARELKEDESSSLKRIETESIYFKIDDAAFWKGC